MDLHAGAIVAGRYRLVRQLGEGGMGAVWLAQHSSLGSTCAIKFIHDEAADRPEARQRFDTEAKASAQLRSENVVQILDYGVSEDGLPYLVMEHLVGEALSDRLKRLGRLGAAETYNVISGVARALSKAHAAGIVHRDLKPDNVFLCRDEDREIPKVLDFGIAKHTGLVLQGSNTRTGALLGTPYYMSPEQAQGIKSVDGRADLWSLAVVTFRCMTGELPFRSEALGDLLMKLMTHPVPVPSHVARGLPEGFDRWVERAMQRDPDRRFQTAREFSDALGLALGVSHAGAAASPAAAAQGYVPTLGQTRVGTASDLRLTPDAALPFGHGAAQPGAAAPAAGAYPGYPPQAPARQQTYGGAAPGVAPAQYPQQAAPLPFAPGGTAYAAESPFNQSYAPSAGPVPGAGPGGHAAPAPYDQTSSGLHPLPQPPELGPGAHALGGPSMSGLEAPAHPPRAAKGRGAMWALVAVVLLGGGAAAAFFAFRTTPEAPSSAAPGTAAPSPSPTATAAPAPSATSEATPTASESAASESAESAPASASTSTSTSTSTSASSAPEASTSGARTSSAPSGTTRTTASSAKATAETPRPVETSTDKLGF